jgi:alkaline phosphatase
MIDKSFLLSMLCVVAGISSAQRYSPSSIFSHNDYAQPSPFFGAYNNGVGYIEADVFLKNDELFVAHFRGEIENERKLTALYLVPLQKMIVANKGWAYADSSLTLTLMVDLKTEGANTVTKLASELSKFKELLTCKTLRILISGNVPDPSLWSGIPAFISIDGRPNVSYTEEQWERIGLVSTNINSHIKWNARSELTTDDKIKLQSLVAMVHAKGKKLRLGRARFRARMVGLDGAQRRCDRNG